MVLFTLAILPSATARAQIRIDLRPAGPRISVEALTGGRFGVGRMTVIPTKEMVPEVLGVDGFCLDERDGRVLYPAVSRRVLPPLAGGLFGEGSPLIGEGAVPEEVGGLVRGLLDRPPRTTIYFLFRGEEPMEVELQGSTRQTVSVTPRHDPAGNRRRLAEWWKAYTAPPRLLEKEPDYPPLVENYLKANLARRLSLTLPETERTAWWPEQLGEEVGLTLGTESIRLGMQQYRVLGLTQLHLPADQPLPEPLDVAPVEVPAVDEHVRIEPIARHVPAECFYLRFGSFANFLWLNDTLSLWGGDLQNLLAARGLDYGQQQQIEEQLVAKQTTLTRLLGGTMISDVAIIGTDLFFREGAAFGILFEARQTDVLGTALSQERAKRLKLGGVSETKLQIAGREVSYIASPDGRVRSYYAVDGNYHFVTTSKTLVRRFLEAGAGRDALGGSAEFRHARARMPLDGDITVFAYLSSAFYRNLTSPGYRVEIARRLQAASDIDLVQLAVLASATEGKPGATIKQLIAAEMLPESFGRRPDGSQTIWADGKLYDSLRGYRGAFVPIPDVAVGQVSRAEAATYRRFADYYRQQWGGRMDPTMIGVRRTALEGNRENVVLNLELSPFAEEHFETLSQWIGPADEAELAPIPGNVATAELVLSGQRLFAGLRNSSPPATSSARSVLPDVGGSLTAGGRLLPGYLGTVGGSGPFGAFSTQLFGATDEAGYARSVLGLWRRSFTGLTVFSFQRETLEAVTPRLKFQQAARPAQLRVQIGDVSRAKLTPLINDFGYSRTRDTSLGNIRLMHALQQQLHVPAEDCRDAAQLVADARLVCPFGGQYVLRKSDGGVSYWTSTALPTVGGRTILSTQTPEGYRSPPLSWFRGLDLDARMTRGRLSARAEVVMQKPDE